MRLYEELSHTDIGTVANRFQCSEQEVAVRAAKQLLRDSCSFRERLQRHFVDLIVLFLIVPVPLLLFRFVARQSFPHGKSQQVIVANQTGIPAYHVIVSGDVALATVATVPGSLGKANEVIGRYATQPLQGAATILSAYLSSDKVDPGALAGRRTMLIPVRAGNLPSSTRLPLHVALHISSAGTSPSQESLSVGDVYILDFKSTTDPSLAVVAIQPRSIDLLTRHLGTSEVYISQAIP